MSKGSHRKKPTKSLPSQGQPSTSTALQEVYDSEDEGGFSKWWREGEGTELMKLFVIGNSLVVFLVMSWPNIREALISAQYIIYGENNS